MKTIIGMAIAGLMMVGTVAHADAIDDAYESSESFYHEIFLSTLNEHDKQIWKEIDLVSSGGPVYHTKHQTDYMGTVIPSGTPSTVMPDTQYMGTVRQ